jgi:hypothetical protein
MHQEPDPLCAALLNTYVSQKDDFLYVRLAMSREASEHYADNDLVLLCKLNPMVCI